MGLPGNDVCTTSGRKESERLFSQLTSLGGGEGLRVSGQRDTVRFEGGNKLSGEVSGRHESGAGNCDGENKVVLPKAGEDSENVIVLCLQEARAVSSRLVDARDLQGRVVITQVETKERKLTTIGNSATNTVGSDAKGFDPCGKERRGPRGWLEDAAAF